MGTVSPIRILMIGDPAESLRLRSSEDRMRRLFSSLDERWLAHLLHGRPVKYRRLPFRYVVHKVPFGSRPSSPIFRLLYLMAAIVVGVRAIKKHRIYLVFTKSGHLYLGLVALITARLTHRKCLVRVNEDDVLALRLFLKRRGFPRILVSLFAIIAKAVELLIFRNVDWVITHGPKDYERIGRVTNRISFVPLGVDTSVFAPLTSGIRELKETLVGDAEKKVLLFVGRLNPMKGLPTLFRALKMLSETRNDLVLLIAGSGMEEARYREMVKRMGISDKVYFLGFVPHARLPLYYNIADVCVLPSLWEEWSNTIMEAMACGVPVVATNVGANPYLIKDGETGFLVPPKEPRALAEKIAFVLDNPELAEEIARKARAEIAKYSIMSMSSAYKKIMLNVIKSYWT